jgi:hypothetical protein
LPQAERGNELVQYFLRLLTFLEELASGADMMLS